MRLKTYASLIVPTLFMFGIPIIGFPFGSKLIDSHLSTQSLLGMIWSSRYDFGGRLWLLGSFITTLIVTLKVVNGFMLDDRYNCLRKVKHFRTYANAVLGFAIALPFLGLFGLFVPVSWGGMYVMKGLALITGIWMLLFDLLMLKVVSDKDPTLKREFSETVRLIDIPVTGSIFLVLALAYSYAHWILPPDTNLVSSNEIFVVGLSSGAVAVEIWFANLLYWLLFHQPVPSQA